VVPWRSLSDGTQEALLKDARLSALAAERRKQCKGVTIGEVTLACEKTDRAMNDRLVDVVRSGSPVPVPALIP